MTKPPYSASPIDHPLSFQDALSIWFQRVAEPHPWRKTTDPYEVLVSEVMLQQTTIQAVRENQRYEKFLEEFPNTTALANATEQEILKAWEGLGYYNRVRNLQKATIAVNESHGGEFPHTLAGLSALPGIGPYTAAAVASFAYDLSAPLVDANVSRVFARLFDDETPINSPKGQKIAWGRAEKLVPENGARLYNSALMELGQKVCRNKAVLCEECPVSSFCQTRVPLTLPKKKPKAQTIEITEYALWNQKRNGDLLLQKGDGSSRKGMWTLPLISKEEALTLPLLHESKYAITKYKVTLKIYQAELDGIEIGEWIPLSEQEDLPMPSPIRLVINELQEHL